MLRPAPRQHSLDQRPPAAPRAISRPSTAIRQPLTGTSQRPPPSPAAQLSPPPRIVSRARTNRRQDSGPIRPSLSLTSDTRRDTPTAALAEAPFRARLSLSPRRPSLSSSSTISTTRLGPSPTSNRAPKPTAYSGTVQGRLRTPSLASSRMSSKPAPTKPRERSLTSSTALHGSPATKPSGRIAKLEKPKLVYVDVDRDEDVTSTHFPFPVAKNIPDDPEQPMEVKNEDTRKNKQEVVNQLVRLMGQNRFHNLVNQIELDKLLSQDILYPTSHPTTDAQPATLVATVTDVQVVKKSSSSSMKKAAGLFEKLGWRHHRPSGLGAVRPSIHRQQPRLADRPVSQVFGAKLESMNKSTCIVTFGSGIHVLPTLPFLVIEEIYRRGIQTPGLLRVAGDFTRIDSLFQFFSTCPSLEATQLDLSREDIHTLCGLLKQFFRALPDPLIPSVIFDGLYSACIDANPDNPDAIEIAAGLIRLLPTRAGSLFIYLASFLSQVPKFPENRISVEALASVFGPAIFCDRSIGFPGLGLAHSSVVAEEESWGDEALRAQNALKWVLWNWERILGFVLASEEVSRLEPVVGEKEKSRISENSRRSLKESPKTHLTLAPERPRTGELARNELSTRHTDTSLSAVIRTQEQRSISVSPTSATSSPPVDAAPGRYSSNTSATHWMSRSTHPYRLGAEDDDRVSPPISPFTEPDPQLEDSKLNFPLYLSPKSLPANTLDLSRGWGDRSQSLATQLRNMPVVEPGAVMSGSDSTACDRSIGGGGVAGGEPDELVRLREDENIEPKRVMQMLSGLIGSRESIIAYQNTALATASNDLNDARERIKELEMELEKTRKANALERELRENLELKLQEKLIDNEKLWSRLEAVKRALTD